MSVARAGGDYRRCLQELGALGKVIKLGHVQVEAENGETRERLILLFPGVLVMLSMGPRLSGYTYQVSRRTHGIYTPASSVKHYYCIWIIYDVY